MLRDFPTPRYSIGGEFAIALDPVGPDPAQTLRARLLASSAPATPTFKGDSQRRLAPHVDRPAGSSQSRRPPASAHARRRTDSVRASMSVHSATIVAVS